MPAISPCTLPDAALLRRYAADAEAYTDCYRTRVARDVSLADFVFAFYTAPSFRPERVILKHVVNKPSTDDDARALATGQCDRFAAWNVEARTEVQLLLTDFRGRTRSWLMVAPVAGGGTQLYFGSAAVPAAGSTDGGRRLDGLVQAMLGFHKVYSRVLLAGAARRLG